MSRALAYVMWGREVKRERNETQVNKSINKRRLGMSDVKETVGLTGWRVSGVAGEEEALV